MKTSMQLRRRLATWQVLAILTLAGGAAIAAPPIFSSYNAVSDILGVAHETDSLLVNPWGIAIGQLDGNLRVSDGGKGVLTIYQPDGTLVTGTVGIAIPSVSGSEQGTPTGVTENYSAFVLKTDSNDFDIASTTGTAPAHYIFGTQDGGIVGYRDIVSATTGILAVTSTDNAGYTGVALSYLTGTNGDLHHTLYAADFANAKIDVYDSKFNVVTLGTNAFAPPADLGTFLTLPTGLSWSPFNIKNVDFLGKNPTTKKYGVQRVLFVAYAVHSGTSDVLNDVPGEGNGYVDEFYPDGTRVNAGPFIPPGGHLNSPWGMAFSHHNYAGLGGLNVLLVGNHGDGEIRAFAFQPGIAGNGADRGVLVKDKSKTPLAFDGLWALHFGPKPVSEPVFIADEYGILDEDVTNLYFSAGLLGETHGLVGDILH